MEKNATILVVDDDKEIADLVEIYLVNDGYRVLKASDGSQCLDILAEHPEVRMLILDIMMPGIDGLEVCRRIRKTSNIPILMLSAKAEDMDKIVGFGTGADDYLTKPFHPLELLARVKSQMKRYTTLPMGQEEKEDKNDEIKVQNLTINKTAHVVKKDGHEIARDRVFSTDEIFERVWNEKVYEVNNTVMVHIRRLREKIEDNSRSPKILKTVWGVGYKIESESV